MRVVVEQHAQPRLGRQAHVVSAVLTDMEVGGELAMEQHLFAGRAFLPQVLRDFALPDELAQLRAHPVLQPVHPAALRTRAARTPSASSPT